jgi:integrase
MSDTRYLQKRANTWYVVVEVPKTLRAAEVPPRFVQSLQTSNLAEAQRRKHPVVAEFQGRVDRLRHSHSPKAAIMRDASEWKAAREAARREDGEGSDTFQLLTMQIQELSAQLAEKDRALAQGFNRTALGKGTIIKDEYPVWIAEDETAEQTKVQHGSTVRRYLSWAGEFTTVEDTTRQRAGEYVSELLANSGLSRRTVKRHLSSLSSLWKWLKGKGRAGENVWLQHNLGKKPKKRHRSCLSDEALLKLLHGSYSTFKFAGVLSDLTRLGLLHGARLEELCALKKRDVIRRPDGYLLDITSGKTDAAERKVPVHPAAVSIIQRRLKCPGEFLFEGLEPGGPDGKRSWYVSKAYGRFRKQVGVDGVGEDFHALRTTFIEHMERLGVPESTTKLLVGHERGGSMTYGHYSEGALVDLRTAIERLVYSPKVMAAI